MLRCNCLSLSQVTVRPHVRYSHVKVEATKQHGAGLRGDSWRMTPRWRWLWSRSPRIQQLCCVHVVYCRLCSVASVKILVCFARCLSALRSGESRNRALATSQLLTLSSWQAKLSSSSLIQKPNICKWPPCPGLLQTLARARLMATNSGLESFVPLGRLSLGSSLEMLFDSAFHSLHLPSLYTKDDSGLRLLHVAKLYLDFNLPLVSECSKSGCLVSCSCLYLSVIVSVSLRMCVGL